MELVDGEDLSARIARGALDEALPIARAVRHSSSGCRWDSRTSAPSCSSTGSDGWRAERSRWWLL
jgi:hypothetical protein